MIGFGQPVVDVVAGAGMFKGMSPKALTCGHGQLDLWRCRTAVAWGGEVGAIVSGNSVDLIGNSFDQLLEKVGGGPAGGLFNQPGKSELGSAIHGDEQIELPLLSAD